MQSIIAIWSSLPPEARGAIELWAAMQALNVFRVVANRYLPANAARRWIEAADLVAHLAAANSRPLSARIAPDPKRKP